MIEMEKNIIVMIKKGCGMLKKKKEGKSSPNTTMKI